MAKKKKSHKVLITLLILIPLLIIATPVAVIYGLFYVNEPSTILKDENFKEEEMIERIIHNSFERVKDDKALSIGLSESDMNQLLIKAVETMDENVKQFVDAPFVTIDSETKKFDIYLNLHVPLFKTQVKISTTILFDRMKQNEEFHQGILFKINEIKLGRTNIGDFTYSIISEYFNDDMINTTFANAGFNIKSYLKDKTLFYSAADLVNDVAKQANLDQFYLSMLDFVIEGGFLDINYQNKVFGLDFKLDKFTSNVKVDENYETTIYPSTKGYDVKILANLEHLETLLAKEIISEDKVPMMLDYLNDGYVKSSQEVKAYVDGLDLSSINIANPSAHMGLNNLTSKTIDGYFSEQLPQTALQLNEVYANKALPITLTEKQINDTLNSSKIIGQCVPFVFKGFTAWHVNSIFVDDFIVNMMDEQLIFIITLNINGLRTKLIVPCKIISSQGPKLTLEMNNIEFGQLRASEKIQNEIINYIADAMSNISTWFKKGEGNLLTLDFTSCIDKVLNQEFKDKLNNATLIANITGNVASDVGKLNLTFKLDK